MEDMNGILSDYITTISFLIATSSFILGLYLQFFPQLSDKRKRHYRILILSLIIPSIIMVGIGFGITPGNGYYVVLLVLMLTPVAVILSMICGKK